MHPHVTNEINTYILHTLYTQGDILLVAEQFDDGWLRGIRLSDLEVTLILSLVFNVQTLTYTLFP